MKYKAITIIFAGILSMSCTSDEASSQNSAQKMIQKAFPWLKNTGKTDDMIPVGITLISRHIKTNNHSLKFSIPKAYLRDKTHWKGGEQEGIEIQTGLPDLLPLSVVRKNLTRPNQSGYEESKAYADRGLYVYIDRHSYMNSYHEKTQEERNEIANGKRKSYAKSYHRQENQYDLEYYKDINCSDVYDSQEGVNYHREKKCQEDTREYFLTPINYPGIWLSFDCTRLDVNLRGGCIVKTRYRRKGVTYIFRRNQLYRWQEFDTAVRKLLDQFLIEEREIDKIIFTRKTGE